MEENIIELFIDEENDFAGIEAISIVENPAIEEDFIALKAQEIKLAEIDAEKRILMGAALIPDKKIYRHNGEEEYYIFFSKETVRKASELFLTKGKQNNSTLEHEVELNGLSVVESWIIEDEKKDKSAKYNLNLPIGTWMVVKEQMDYDEFEALAKLFELEDFLLKGEEIELETYSDYPQAARNNAKRALKWKEENGSECGTLVGWTRANQLASGENISRSTIARMASFKRHQQHKDVPYSDGCGGIMWDAWGGSSGVNWAINKLKQIDK